MSLVQEHRLGFRVSAVLDTPLHGDRCSGTTPITRPAIPEEFHVVAERLRQRRLEVLEHPVGVAPDDDERRHRYWINSSARASTDGGIVRPRALAVLRLMTSSTFVGCSSRGLGLPQNLRGAGVSRIPDNGHKGNIGDGLFVEL